MTKVIPDGLHVEIIFGLPPKQTRWFYLVTIDVIRRLSAWSPSGRRILPDGLQPVHRHVIKPRTASLVPQNAYSH